MRGRVRVAQLLAHHKIGSIEAKDLMTRRRFAMNLSLPVIGTQMSTSSGIRRLHGEGQTLCDSAEELANRAYWVWSCHP